jgi:hypothetical protein
VPKPRLVHLAWLYVHDWSSVTPIFLPTVRFCPALQEPEDPHCWVSRTTEIVIEGYPRSGNTFAVVAFRLAQGREIEIAHHLHAAAQIKRAARLDVPAFIPPLLLTLRRRWSRPLQRLHRTSQALPEW